jgi:integral membrane protein
MNWLEKYEQFRPFTEAEAWGIFRLAAIAEAVGWTLLISGILIGKYLTPHSGVAVQIAGHTHGIFFLIYITAVIVLYPSQGWSRRRTIVAGMASVPPFGSLMFEQWAAHKRNRSHLYRQVSLITYNSFIK